MTAPLPPALVLTAGLGTRLAPLSDIRAKPAVPVAGVPLIIRILRWLSTQGVRSAVLNLHHRPETITGLVGHGDDVGLDVRYSWEPRILGSAGGPRQALAMLGPRFFIINGDTITDLDLSAVRADHDGSGAEVTLVVTDNPDPTRYGGVTVDEEGRARAFHPPGGTGRHFLGIQLVESIVFEPLAKGEPAATIGGIYNDMLDERPGRIATHDVRARFHDVGTAADYLNASLQIGRAEGLDASPVGARCQIDPTATLTRTIVWDDVSIGPDCHLSECIVADRASVAAGTTCQRSLFVPAGGTTVCVPIDTAPARSD